MLSITDAPSVQQSIIVLYGPPGVGKSTLIAKRPDTICVDIEGGLKRTTASRIDPPKQGWNRDLLMQAVDVCAKTSRSCIAIDTIDRVEMIIKKAVADAHPKSNGNIANIPYGAGYDQLYAWFAEFYNALKNTGKDLVLVAHAGQVKDPSPGGERTIYGPNLYKKNNDLLIQDSTAILFCVDEPKQSGPPDKVIYTQHTSWCVGKCRAGLPEKISFDWNEILGIPSADLLAKAQSEMDKLDPAKRARAEIWMRSNPTTEEIKRMFPALRSM